MPAREITKCWRDDNDLPAYQCKFTLPVDLMYVEEDKAEKITLFANPSIKSSLKAIFSIHDREANFHDKTGAVTQVKGPFMFNFGQAPSDAAFKIFYRDEKGDEYPLESSFWVTKNSGGHFDIQCDLLPIEQSGIYKGALIFKPDIETAYKNPNIKSIWDGTLEFPIKFEVIKK